MAENIRSITEILEELFKANDSALNKYAKVRHTQYEIKLWRDYGLPINEVDKTARFYFQKRFLDGVRIDKADSKEIKKALITLNHAVKDGCYKRCYNLTIELNDALKEAGITPVGNIDSFLDWLTFAYKPRRGYDGEVLKEEPYGFPILDFYDSRNRKEFWAELKQLLSADKMLSMHDVARIVMHKRRNGIRFNNSNK